MPKDYFALLGMPRRPWIDLEGLQSKFVTLSAERHPDRIHSATVVERETATERFRELNAAYSCLKDTKRRLGHLVELETGRPPANLETLAAGSSDFYFAVGQACRAADHYLKQKPSSPLLRVQFYQGAMDRVEKLQGFQSALEARRKELEGSLEGMNAAWESAPPLDSAERKRALPLRELEQVFREMSYVTRWAEQTRQRVLELSL